MDSIQPNSAKRSRSKKWLKWGLAIVVLALLGGLVYWQYSEAQNAQRELDSTKTQLSQAQADIKTLKDNYAGEKKEYESLQPAKTNDELIKEVVKADARAAVTAKDTTFTVTIVKQVGDFAYVSVGAPEGGGYGAYLKKVDGTWVIIVKGQEMPDAATIQRYGLPSTVTSH